MIGLLLFLAAQIDGPYAVATGLLTLAGSAAATYALVQGTASKRRADRTEAAAAALKERTVDREDFDSVVEGLRGVIAERTAQYNDLLATHKDVVASCRAERDEFIARIRILETEAQSFRHGGTAP